MMITRENWPEDWSRVPDFTEISEDVYNHFLNVLPPRIWVGDYFQCSEPYTHDAEWPGGYPKPMYMTFGKKDGKCYYLGIQYYGGYPGKLSYKEA